MRKCYWGEYFLCPFQYLAISTLIIDVLFSLDRKKYQKRSRPRPLVGAIPRPPGQPFGRPPMCNSAHYSLLRCVMLFIKQR